MSAIVEWFSQLYFEFKEENQNFDRKFIRSKFCQKLFKNRFVCKCNEFKFAQPFDLCLHLFLLIVFWLFTHTLKQTHLVKHSHIWEAAASERVKWKDLGSCGNFLPNGKAIIFDSKMLLIMIVVGKFVGVLVWLGKTGQQRFRWHFDVNDNLRDDNHFPLTRLSILLHYFDSNLNIEHFPFNV